MKIRNRIMVISISLFFLALSLAAIIYETPDYSESERRVLAGFPEVGIEAVLSGEFSDDFDEYAVERFPGRDFWRRVKAYAKTGLFQQKDNNGIYTAGQHISKMEYPINMPMLDYAAQLFGNVKETYLKDHDIYLAVIPDKNRYLAEENGHLSLDYEAFSSYMAKQMPYAEYIEIADLLEADDYYVTDSHWRQDAVMDVAERIADAMGTDISGEYEAHQLEVPFYGVYVGQSALHCEPDTITYLMNDTMQHVELTGAAEVYDMKKANGKDPYEMFLSGNQPVVSIKNSACESENRLVIFRDSFASSLAPLFIGGYSEIVLVDLRYVASNLLGEYVDFTGADVLFLYSTTVLNNSRSLR